MTDYAHYEVKVMFILQRGNGDYLFLQVDDKNSAVLGYLNPPAGHVEVGETVQEAIRREAEEEFGLQKLTKIEIKGIVNVKGFKERPILMFVATGVVPENQQPSDRGAGKPTWVSQKDFRNHKILEDLETILKTTAETPKGQIFQAVSEFKDKKLVSFKVETFSGA